MWQYSTFIQPLGVIDLLNYHILNTKIWASEENCCISLPTLPLPCLKFKSHFSNSSNDTFRTFISEEFINLLIKRPTVFTTLWVLSQHRAQRHRTSVLVVDETHTNICHVWINSASSQSPFSGHFRHRTKHNFLCPLCNYPKRNIIKQGQEKKVRSLLFTNRRCLRAVRSCNHFCYSLSPRPCPSPVLHTQMRERLSVPLFKITPSRRS